MNGIFIDSNIKSINTIKIFNNSKINEILKSDCIGYYNLIDYIDNEYYLIYVDINYNNNISNNYINFLLKNINKNINSYNGLCLIVKYNLLTHNIIKIENNIKYIIDKFI
jgi:hypothetical protein|tara:strand:- start:809 stop:1138 length:330 start_codon:yes stop_codon:yes gene_type:complete